MVANSPRLTHAKSGLTTWRVTLSVGIVVIVPENDKESVAAFAEKLNMKDICYMLAETWDSLERQSLKYALNKLRPNLEGEKDFNDYHKKEITDFVQSISEFQECDEENIETWMACDAENCRFKMLNYCDLRA
ncbi:hypothetical protein TNCV_579401 [Trichonephila clavipes]|nr:hypothetical protein TNCV_579401 [Trichonephila clavipes]